MEKRFKPDRAGWALIPGYFRGAFFVVSTLILLVLLNVVQMASLVVLPFHGGAFRRINRELANFYWGLLVFIMHRIYQMEFIYTGDQVPAGENAFLIPNHQDFSDILVLMPFAKSKRRLGDMKWFVKDIIKYCPGPGWGMLFLDCLYVKRNWNQDKDYIRSTFERINRNKVPCFLISFLEGTRITPEKLEAARQWADGRGLPLPENVLIPRTRGFTASMEGLRGHLDAVYDLTLLHPDGVPTLWQIACGFVPDARIHVRRFPIAEVPEDEQATGAWLRDLFMDKDRLIAATIAGIPVRAPV